MIVVGSGPSGSVIASELTGAGVKCLMLEAGKYYPLDSLTYPEIDYYSRLYWSGGMELDTSCKNGIMRGKAVGGGTLAYQAIMCRFDEYVFSYWREKSGIPYFTVEELLKILRFLPTFVIRALLKLTQLDRFFPGSIGRHLRKLDIGLRGIVFSLYYSFLDVSGGYGQRIKEAIRWDGDIRFKPEKADELPDLMQAANPFGRV